MIGYELFFQQSKLSLTVPIFNSTNNLLILDKNPLINLEVVDVKSAAVAVNVTFKLEKEFDFLKLEKSTGQLKFIRKNFREFGKDESEKVFDDIVVTAENKFGSSAKLSIALRVKKFNDLSSFCMTENLCFYNQITHHILEDFSDDFTKPREIGELSPRIFTKLCKAFDVSYKQLNGDEKNCLSYFLNDTKN